jgi:hypothetical protein
MSQFNSVILRQSSTAGIVPDPVEVLQGELAVNLADRKLYSKNAAGSVIYMAADPVGTAGGDLQGTYPNPKVHKIHGVNMQSGTPNDGDLWQYHALNTRWRYRSWTQCATDGGVTAAGLALLDDADAAAQRTTLGLGTTDAPKFATVSLENNEFISNSTNGRIELRPSPTGSTLHGFYTDFLTANKVRIGTIQSTTNSPNLVPLEAATDFDIAGGYAFGLGSQAARFWYMQLGNPSSTLGRLIFTTTVNNSDHTGAFIFGGIGTQNSVNRSPTSQVNPTVYVYSNDTTSANDFVRIFHDQTNGTVNCGDGNLILSGATGVRINGSFGFGVTPTAVATGYTTFSNLTPDKSCNANATTVDELADILGTLIEDLKAKGIISA